jgi:uncharacterized protein YdiU (UPF0061 family)
MTVHQSLMKESNPVMVPRNHWVEERLDAMEKGQDVGFNQGLEALSNPYNPENLSVNQAPSADYDSGYSTFCGT